MRAFIFKNDRKDGFTFMELLVVIATVGILAVLLLPALAGTKPNSQAFQCMQNQRQMVLASQMYSDDNGGKIAPNYPQGGPNGPATLISPTAYPCWVAGWLTLPGGTTTSENTNTAMLIDHFRYPNGAFLGPYIKITNAFRCPADQSVALLGGRSRPRVRSISMNNFLGSPAQATTSSAIGAPSAKGYYPYSKIANLKSPTLTFVFVDEREDSINDGTLYTDVDFPNTFIIDVPANRHNGAAGISFADGHTEMHQWTSALLKAPIQSSPRNNLLISGDPAGLQDSYWLCQHALGLTSFP